MPSSKMMACSSVKAERKNERGERNKPVTAQSEQVGPNRFQSASHGWEQGASDRRAAEHFSHKLFDANSLPFATTGSDRFVHFT